MANCFIANIRFCNLAHFNSSLNANCKSNLFKSVCKAHKEYRSKTTRPHADQITLYLQNNWNEAGVSGIYRKWIVLQSMLKGAYIFSSMTEKDFYKI